jgi:hypothetical protein
MRRAVATPDMPQAVITHKYAADETGSLDFVLTLCETGYV